MALATGMDVEEVCRADQLCSGLKAGAEGAVHAMRDLFEDQAGSGWRLLLVDASNAFNSVNREAALWSTSPGVYDSFQHLSWLCYTCGTWLLYSMEGVNQGDHLSMMMYAVVMLPLIR